MIELKKLPYDYDALEPVIGSETLHFHHDKHHQTYVDNVNKLVTAIPGFEKGFDCVKVLMNHIKDMPEANRQGVLNNAGGVYNHNLYFESMTPGGSKEPVGTVKEKIEQAFGSFEKFKEEFENAGATQFGSGWAWLVADENGNVYVTKTKNQDTPYLEGKTPLLCNDVWEHAYYLDFQNKRAAYLKDWWTLVNWDIVERRYQEALNK